MDTVDELEGHNTLLSQMADEVCGLIERVPVYMRTTDTRRLMQLISVMRDLHATVESVKKAVNKAAVDVDSYACDVLLNKEKTLLFRTDFGTFSASVKGYFSVKDVDVFLAHLDGDVTRLVEFMQSKKELSAYCEGILENGAPMPPGISKHIVPKITVRRR